MVVPTGAGSCAVQLRCTHDTEDAELSLRIDENNDVTCDHLWADERVRIRSAWRAGNRFRKKDLVLVDGERVAVRLGALVAGRDYRVDVEYEVPDSASTAGIRPAGVAGRTGATFGRASRRFGLSHGSMTGRLEMRAGRALGGRARIRLAGAAARQYQLSGWLLLR